MEFSKLFDVFSRRPTHAPTNVTLKPLTTEFRTRVLMRFQEVVAQAGIEGAAWTDLWKRLAYLQGTMTLGVRGSDPRDEAGRWLMQCSDPQFLDALEMIFRHGEGRWVHALEPLIESINVFLQRDDLPYALTQHVWEEVPSDWPGGKAQRVAEFPRVIRKDSQVVHAMAVGPTLELLADGRFGAANKEFLQALEDFRKGDYGDCLTKCGSAFESVLKIVCTIKGLPFQPTDTAKPLLDAVIKNSGLETFFEQPLLLVATMRNRLSTSHGGGTQPRSVTAAQAEYAINATSAAILLVVHHSI